MARRTTAGQAAVVGALAMAAPFACTPQFDATRNPEVGETVGQQLYGVICDRVGAQALTDDLTGASYTNVCHPSVAGTYSDAVDQTQLPTPQQTTTASGAIVTLAEAQATRNHAVARVNALAADRTKLITAFNATLPVTKIPVKNTTSTSPAQTCDMTGATDTLTHELADMLGRFTPLYDDGTIPTSTEGLARVMDALQANQAAQTSFARFDAREGYRPLSISLGAVAPVLAWSGLRDFSNATVSLLASNANPFAATPTPGAAYPEMTTLLEAAYQELRTATGDGNVAPLVLGATDTVGRSVLSRPRTDLEFMQQIFYAESPSFGGGASRYITRRDSRGYAYVLPVGGQIPAPFVDMNHDGLADVDGLGLFVTTSGKPAPSPFLSPDGTPALARDSYGRALSGMAGGLVYDSIDTSHTYAASMMNDMEGLVIADPSKNHETLMNALAGMYVMAGVRGSSTSATKQYSPDPTAKAIWSLTHTGTPPASLDTTPVSLAYAGFLAQKSPMLDLVYGFLQTVSGPTNDDLLAYLSTLLTSDTAQMARLIGDGLVMKQNANAATTAHIPATSTFWDEMLDVAVQVEQEPGLLEDILTALGDDRTPGLAQAFSNYSKYNDQISYDRSNINGPAYNVTTSAAAPMSTPVDRSKPDNGYNRSAFQRFLQIVHDTDGLTVCNKDGATVDAQLAGLTVTMPADDPCDNYGQTYPECAVYKIDNAAAFYLDSIIGKASLYLRDDELREGVGTDGGVLCSIAGSLASGLTAATVGLMQNSSGITGSAGNWTAFWDDSSSTTLRPTPQFLDRQMFFDLANDSPNGSGPNAMTNTFLNDLDGANIGTTVCPERIITDPYPNAPDASPDGLVHGLRTCQPSDTLYQRDNNTIFVWEDFSFYDSITPVLTAFANHKREDLFIALMEVLDRHWADQNATADECLLSSDPSMPYRQCSKDGLVTYEPLMVQQYLADILPALHDLSKTLQTMTVPHCDSIDAVTHSCTPTTLTGISVLANGTRQLLDPKIAAAAGLKDRYGNVTALRNDGTTNPQVTPIYLVLEALNNIDAGFASYAAAHPTDAQRQATWLSARSQLVDQFLSVSGSGSTSSFADASVPAILPVLVTTLREQIVSHCASSFSPPYPACAWTTSELLGNMQATMTGPLFAGMMGLGDAIRKDTNGRTQLESLLTYLLDAGSKNDALPALLAASDDLIQVLRDDENLVPFYEVAAEAARPSVLDAQGNIVQKGTLDATLTLLSRLTGRVYAEPTGQSPVEDCSKEIDPNQVLTVALQNLVTPMASSTGALAGETPLQVILDAIADVNRASPETTSKLAPTDYMSIAENLSDFLTNQESGLEQFYAVVRQGTE
jgi:hypothetical protein